MARYRRFENNRNLYFRNRYRIPSARLRGWDYASDGYYFVTICGKDRIPCFAKIIGGKVHLSPIGEIIAEEWENTAKIRKFVDLDEWVIMPDHLHGIIAIKHPDQMMINTPHQSDVETCPCDRIETPRYEHVETPRCFNVETPRQGVSTLKPNSLGSIIGQFKSKTTKRIHAMGYLDFGWDPRFYDHVIRDEADLQRIRQYIQANPARWK